MFKECFRFPGRNGTFKEMSFSDMLMEIRSYCDFTVYESKIYKSKEDVIIPPPPLDLREATQAEIGRIKGEAMLLAGHNKAARTEMVAAYQRGERDPNLLAALGLLEKASGEEERARKFLEAAYVGNTRRADGLVELARYRYADALAKPEGPEGRFSGAQVSGIMKPLLVARRQPPPHYAVYDLAADTLARSALKSQHDDAVMLVEGAQLFPMRFKLIYQAAAVAADAGDLQPAHALLDHGIKYAPEGEPRRRFEELKAALPPAPPSPPQPEKSAPVAAQKK
jgi:hypothetical protein